MTLPTVEALTARAAELFALWRVRDASIEVAWNRRLRTCAGRAFVQHGRVELNPNLLEPAPEEIDGVLVHEAAHVAAWRLFGAAAEAHGRHWRALMRLAGLPPEVTHDLAIPARRPRRGRFAYLRVCDSCGDRRVMAALRYGRCHGCSRRDSYLVLRAPATAAGRAALGRVTLADARARCDAIMERR
ncbi:MAG: SprT-like domain-containing protein [Planctomycetes bacterium]|nr:SprT-like domain-containing protein [Planctomycetota bacterium]